MEIRIHPIYKTEKMHTGMDFTSPVGTEIHATGNGVSEQSRIRRTRLREQCDHISHGFGYQTLARSHEQDPRSARAKGQPRRLIGYVGNTRNFYRPHLHYEVLKGVNRSIRSTITIMI